MQDNTALDTVKIQISEIFEIDESQVRVGLNGEVRVESHHDPSLEHLDPEKVEQISTVLTDNNLTISILTPQEAML